MHQFVRLSGKHGRDELQTITNGMDGFSFDEVQKCVRREEEEEEGW